jgi:glycosyltransferase involved in cell wall biosynthesis
MTDGGQGLLVQKKDSEALAVALGKLALNPDLRSKLGAQGNKTAGNYRWEVVAGRVEQYYKTCLKAANESTDGANRTRTI